MRKKFDFKSTNIDTIGAENFFHKPRPVEVIKTGNVNVNTGTPTVPREQIPSPPSPLVRKGYERNAEHVYVSDMVKRSWEVNDVISRWLDTNYSEYHRDWNKLMEVVDRIEKTHQVTIIDNECIITVTGYESWDIVTVKAQTKQQAVWIACFEFVRLVRTGANIESRK